jgi:hypothetical protein
MFMACIQKNAPQQTVKQGTFMETLEQRLGQLSIHAWRLAERQTEQLGRLRGTSDEEPNSEARPCPSGSISGINVLLDALETSLIRAHCNQSELDAIG